jgi:putative phosphoesterase
MTAVGQISRPVFFAGLAGEKRGMSALRVIVFSDSHGNAGILREIARSQPDAEVFIHLGDGEREFDSLRESYPDKILRSVRGNGDWSSTSKLMDTLVLEKKRILFVHGHTFRAKQSSDMILAEAQLMGADIALYGHTHVAMTDYVDGIYLLNPGSVSLPRHGNPTYGVIDITDAGIVPFIVTL